MAFMKAITSTNKLVYNITSNGDVEVVKTSRKGVEVGGEKRPAFLLFEDEFPKLGSSLKTKNTVTVSKCGGAQQLRGAPVSLSFMGTSQAQPS